MGFSSLDVAFYILWPVTGASKHHDDDSTVIHSASALRGSGNYIVGSIVRWRWARGLYSEKLFVMGRDRSLPVHVRAALAEMRPVQKLF